MTVMPGVYTGGGASNVTGRNVSYRYGFATLPAWKPWYRRMKMPHCSPASVAARHSWAPNPSASDRVELKFQAPSVTEPATVPPAGPGLATRYCWRVASHWAPVARPAAVPTVPAG